MLEQQYEPTKLEMAVGLFSKTATSETAGAVRSTSLRIPISEFAAIEAIAQHSGVSRNKVICTLIDLALPEILANLPKADRKTIDRLTVKNVQAMLQESEQEQAGKGEC